MAICQFFLRGNCKFGSRCRNEHSAPNQRSYNDDNYSRNNYNSRNSKQNYIKPSNFNDYNNRQYENKNNNRQQNNEYDHQSQNYRHSNNRHQEQKGYNNNYDRKSNNRNQYQWNRYEALENEVTDVEIQSEDDKIISTIQEDMKMWANQKMWPYSCYSPGAEKPCLDGLPDISPEELRVLYCFHGLGVYQSIVNEINSLYIRRKEELHEMSDKVRALVLSHVNTTVDSNPSSCIAIYEMYGPNSGSKIPQKSEDLPSTNQSAPLYSQVEEKSMVELQNKQVTPVTAATPSPIAPPSFNSIIASSPGNISSEVTEKIDETYTDISLLTDSEVEQFKSSKFVLGKIPMRPPPKEFCSGRNFQ